MLFKSFIRLLLLTRYKSTKYCLMQIDGPYKWQISRYILKFGRRKDVIYRDTVREEVPCIIIHKCLQFMYIMIKRSLLGGMSIKKWQLVLWYIPKLIENEQMFSANIDIEQLKSIYIRRRGILKLQIQLLASIKGDHAGQLPNSHER